MPRGGVIASATLPAVTMAERQSVTNLLPRSASFAVPAGTRAIQVGITATRSSGSYNDGYVDNVSLTLGSSTPVFHKTVVVEKVSGSVLVKRPGGGFVEFDGSSDIPLGSEVDARKGRIKLTSVPTKPAASRRRRRSTTGCSSCAKWATSRN